MMVRLALVGVLAFASSCTQSTGDDELHGDDGGPGDDDTGEGTVTQDISGTRIKVKWHRTGDGAKVSTGQLYDAHRDEDCTFSIAPDGKVRCLPSITGRYDFRYADAGCTQPLATVSVCQTVVPRYMNVTTYTSTGGNCVDGATRIFRIGAEYAQGTVYVKTTSGCSVTPREAGQRYFSTESEVAPAEFAEATVVVDG